MKAYFFFIFFLLVTIGWAQNAFEGGFLFDLNKDLKINEKHSLKGKLQSRTQQVENDLHIDKNGSVQENRMDLQLAFQRKLKANSSIAFGGLYRVSNQQDLVRFIQQLGWVKEAYRFKWAQRVRLDESIRNKNDIEYRLRYRLGFQLPLEGFRLDNGEKYLATTLELLGKYRNENGHLEGRAGVAYGYAFKSKNKGEFGLDYRLNSINEKIKEHQVWLSVAYFFQ